jgi:hypothetical protein
MCLYKWAKSELSYPFMLQLIGFSAEALNQGLVTLSDWTPWRYTLRIQISILH